MDYAWVYNKVSSGRWGRGAPSDEHWDSCVCFEDCICDVSHFCFNCKTASETAKDSFPRSHQLSPLLTLALYLATLRTHTLNSVILGTCPFDGVCIFHESTGSWSFVLRWTRVRVKDRRDSLPPLMFDNSHGAAGHRWSWSLNQTLTSTTGA